MAYEVNLKEFQGPLDLLLHLIEQAEVDIKDIFISEITAQYLEYMGQIDTLDMDTASEFITMAATLVYIKSRSLLPKPPKENTEEEDPADALIRQLREYRAAKETGERMTISASSFAREISSKTCGFSVVKSICPFFSFTAHRRFRCPSRSKGSVSVLAP